MSLAARVRIDDHRSTTARIASIPSPGPAVTRRELLRRAGVGAAAVVTVAGTAFAWRVLEQHVLTPGAGDAYAAWSAPLVGDGPLPLVRAAVLAANAHDTQPWLFDVAARRIDVYADRARNIGALDPLLREMEISLGCAIENVVLAAHANGQTAEVRLLPTSAADHIARIELAPGSADASRLFDAIPLRRTDRTPYSPERVDTRTLSELAALSEDPRTHVQWLDSDPAKTRFADLTVDATAAIIADTEQSRDDFRWYRQDWNEIQRQRDGITLDAAGIPEPLRTIVRVLPPSDASTLQRGWLDATRARHVATAAAFGLVVVPDRADTRSRVAAGRLFQRIHLSATVRKLAIQPLNQVIERADREAALTLAPRFTDALAQLSTTGSQAVLAFRIGRPTSTPPHAPRRWAEEVIHNP